MDLTLLSWVDGYRLVYKMDFSFAPTMESAIHTNQIAQCHIAEGGNTNLQTGLSLASIQVMYSM